MSMDVVEFPEVTELNVGGKLLTTLLSTLRKEENSMLAAMFSGGHQIARDKDGRYFIDYDGDVFVNILNYLRHGSIPPKEKALEVYECAAYFGVDSLVTILQTYQHVLYKKKITEMKEKLDREQFGKLKQYAITILNENFNPSEDKYFAYVSTPCQNNRVMVRENEWKKFMHDSGSALISGASINIKSVLLYKDELEEACMRCLAHDLCEQGFGTFCYYNTSLSLQCNTCHPRKTIRCKAITLRNKVWKDHDYNWKML
ncbi:BTB/POZ domain-containing protein KCTD14-like isoform X2 [Mercenaria mercenaria]|uniref:BTB/POZ domain-containing protein KCTD14-like isoform X2 n=1 Tax=Mercenaria mercenaria TaxID=6596 RepID=UPI001E1D3DA0|nr:BTB/POZ domain-containing protein KCTD14-like isoform X2 [Mercenaria mercenaria]